MRFISTRCRELTISSSSSEFVRCWARTFLPGEDQTGKSQVAVLSYSVWQQYFGGKKNVIGEYIHLDGLPYTVIGVMPAGFRFRFDTRDVIYTPLQLSPDQIKSRGSFWLPVWGRFKPGVTYSPGHSGYESRPERIGQAVS